MNTKMRDLSEIELQLVAGAVGEIEPIGYPIGTDPSTANTSTGGSTGGTFTVRKIGPPETDGSGTS